jgi:hypothetical protein
MYYGVYRGTAIDVADPTQSGRMKVRVPSLPQADLMNWALVVGPFGNAWVGGRPAVGDEVLVAFEEGDINYPVVLGRLRGTG